MNLWLDNWKIQQINYWIQISGPGLRVEEPTQKNPVILFDFLITFPDFLGHLYVLNILLEIKKDILV